MSDVMAVARVRGRQAGNLFRDLGSNDLLPLSGPDSDG